MIATTPLYCSIS